MTQLPDFIVIGAAKAGTTSLHALLAEHPGFHLPGPKEPEFFARDERYGAGIDSYAAQFAGAAPGQRVGEASTLYSQPLFPETAARIRRHLPEVRLIYVLRQPVERAYSYYVQLTKNYQNATRDLTVHRSFEDFVLPERHKQAAPRDKAFAPFDAHLPDVPELCLAGSDYTAVIETYLEHFPREQMLFLKFEDFRRDMPGVLARVTDFLQVAPVPGTVLEGAAASRNISSVHFAEADEQVALAAMKQRAGGLWKLRELLPAGMRRGLRRAALARDTGGGAANAAHRPPPMQPETRMMLEARFAAQLPRLAERTGLDLSDWGLEAAAAAAPHPAGTDA